MRRRDPRYYDAAKKAAEQSDIPSQQVEAGIPYFPSENVEVFQNTPAGREALAALALQAKAAELGDITSFTRYTYDSRPPMAYDFVGPINDGVFSTSIQLFDGSYTVPKGYIGVVRGFHFTTSTAYMTMTNFGVFDYSQNITIKRNGSSIPGMTNINVSSWGLSQITVECFILLNAGDTISGAWNGGLPLYAFGNGFVFFGQLLLDDGRDLPLQSGNLRPEPVVDVNEDAIGDLGPTAGNAPAAAAGGYAPQVSTQYLTFDAPDYDGPKPPTISIDTWWSLIRDHHAQVRNAYLQYVRQNPGKTIQIRGRYDFATTDPTIV